MLRKQLAYVLNETLNYFFNWNEYTVSQLFLSLMLTLLFCKSLVRAVVNFLFYIGEAVKQAVQQLKEWNNEHGLVLFGIPFKHRHNG